MAGARPGAPGPGRRSPAPGPRPTSIPPEVEPGNDVPPAGPAVAGVGRIRGARSELRRRLREQRRIRATALVLVIALLLGTPLLYLGIQTATRDPVLNSLVGLPVPTWAAQSPEDRIISGSRWCFIDCRFRERRLVSWGDPDRTNQVYEHALRSAGWTRWEVGGCPLVEVDGHYTCWTRDEYTLDLWVHLPACAYDPRHLRPDPVDETDPGQPEAEPTPPAEGECSGAVVEIKMQNRIADERGLPGSGPNPDDPPLVDPPAPTPPALPSPTGSPAAVTTP
jgi:hypothetical protein